MPTRKKKRPKASAKSRRLSELLKILKTGRSFEAMRAAKKLGKLGDLRAVPALCKAAVGGDEWLAQDAAKALGELGSPKAVPALVEALGIQDWTGLLEVIASKIEKAPNPSHAGLAGAQLATDTANVRIEAAIALGKIGDPRAVDGLIAAMCDEHMTAPTEYAATALEKIGTPKALAAVKTWQEKG